MAETSYTHNIATDMPLVTTLTPVLNSIRFDITSSAIATALVNREDKITSDGTDITTIFVDALSAGDETILDTIMADHDPHSANPANWLYKEVFLKGERTAREWWSRKTGGKKFRDIIFTYQGKGSVATETERFFDSHGNILTSTPLDYKTDKIDNNTTERKIQKP
jgi:hypothetical protein